MHEREYDMRGRRMRLFGFLRIRYESEWEREVMSILTELKEAISAMNSRVVASKSVIDAIKVIEDERKKQIEDLTAALQAAGNNPDEIAAVKAGLEELSASFDANATLERVIAGTQDASARGQG